MSGDLIRGINKLVGPLKRMVKGMVSRAVIGLVDDGKKLQEVQASILALEVQDEIERFQNFGFSSVPLPSSEAIVVSVNGVRDHLVAIAIDDRKFRPTGKTAGSSRIYDILGNEFALDADGKAKVLAPLCEIGSGSVKEKTLNGETFQTKYNSHTHATFGVVSTSPLVPSIPTDLSQAVTVATLPT